MTGYRFAVRFDKHFVNGTLEGLTYEGSRVPFGSLPEAKRFADSLLADEREGRITEVRPGFGASDYRISNVEIRTL